MTVKQKRLIMPNAQIRIRKTKGFSMIELMVVVSIIGVIMVIAIPNFARMQRDARIRAGAQEIAQDFRQIRERALAKSGLYQVAFPDIHHYNVIDPAGVSRTYKLAGATGGRMHFGGTGPFMSNPPEATLPAPGILGIDFPGSVLSIDGRSAATSGVVYITDDKNTYAIGINSIGKVKVYIYSGGTWH